MMNRIFRGGLFWPSVVVIASGVCVLVGAQINFAHLADQASARRETTVVENGVASRISEIENSITSVTLWDDAVLHLDNAFSARWTDDNIATYLNKSEGFEAALVLDRRDQPVYGMIDGVRVDLARTRDLETAARELAPTVRTAEARRGPAREVLARAGSVTTPIHSSAIAQLGGNVAIVTATLVQPDFGQALPRTARAPILVTAQAIDDDFIAILANRFLLKDAVLRHEIRALAPGYARVLLKDSHGNTVAALDWRPPQPGKTMLLRALPPTVILLIALAALAWGLYQRGRRATENLIASEARSAHMAYHDALTGLANRALLADRLAYALNDLRRAGKPFAVHCVDLDRFKDVNDTFGHSTGDELIRIVARLLAGTCRHNDTLARLGGDEFAIVQVNATPESAGALADRIVELLALPIQMPVGPLYIGASVGVTLVENGDSEPPECLRQADLALYGAKEGGRGRFAFFNPEMDASVRMRRALQADLRLAMANRELELHYQPQINGQGEVFGLEALVRWTHADRGAVPPAIFVPLAEECGLIDTIGMFTLRRAFEDSGRWPHLKVAVNVSAVQLRRKDFVGRLKALVDEVGIDPRRFELEITEGLLLGDDDQTHESLNEIRAIGFHIALDDFGTGYSSLSYLQRYPIDKIKIDRSFITNLGIEHEAEAVVSAIVKLARALGLSVIAEGVETEAQRERLHAAGCTNVQGFLYGMPACAQDIETMLGGREATPSAVAA